MSRSRPPRAGPSPRSPNRAAARRDPRRRGAVRVPRRDEPRGEEPPGDARERGTDHGVRDEEQRDDDQEADVRDHVAQERDRDAAGGAPPERREEQERQPRDDGADDRGSGDTTPPPLHEPRSLEEPVGGAAPDEREVPGRLALGRGYRSTPALLALSGGIHPASRSTARGPHRASNSRRADADAEERTPVDGRALRMIYRSASRARRSRR